jgi:EmrB/QacA subfamily drug resistance transporter
MPGPSRSDTRWWTLAAVSVATFMTTLDNNIVNVALPTIQRQLGLSMSELEWIVSGYILMFAGLMLVGGRLADLYGHRRVFLAGLAIFTLASLSAGLSGDAPLLIAGRAVQGVGAALLTPTALAVLPVAFPQQRQRNLAVGVWSAVAAVSLALGPFVGGLISQRWHWGWIFLINVPVGVVAFAIGAFAIDTSRISRAARRLDLPGLATSTAALVGLTYALIEGQSRGWTSPPILAAFAGAALAALAFVLVERHATDPMLDIVLFGDRMFGYGTLALGLWAFGVFGVYFFTALYLQDVLGLSPTAAGTAFVPMALAMAAVAAVSGPIAQRVGIRRVVAAGLTLMAAALLGTASVGGDGRLADLMPWLLAYGVGAGLLVPLTGAIIERLPADRAGVASGVLNVSREVFGLLGITLLGAIVGTQRAVDLRHGAEPLQAYLAGYQLALVVAAVIVTAGVPVSLHALRTSRTQLPATTPNDAIPVTVTSGDAGPAVLAGTAPARG